MNEEEGFVHQPKPLPPSFSILTCLHVLTQQLRMALMGSPVELVVITDTQEPSELLTKERC